MGLLDQLTELEDAGEFARRHVAPGEAEIAAMLKEVGAESLDALVGRTVPAAIRGIDLSALPAAVNEAAAIAELRGLADSNRQVKSLIGLGYHGTHTPPVILRNILENPGWYTAYTPYQAEIAQGRLEALVNFQTMIGDLTGLPVANASLLDEATAAAEAMALAHSATRGKSTTIVVADDVLPQTLAVVQVRAEPLGYKVVTAAPSEIKAVVEAEAPFALLLQYPGRDGAVRDLAPEIAAVQAKGGLAIVAADILSLVALKPPGEMGADIAVGSSQRFGVPLGYGGPHAGYMAVKDAHKRLLPGRLVGVSVDVAGAPAMRLALQTREQHIRREKATSNICTAQVLLAVMASMYAVWHGPEGLKRIAARVHLQARLLAGASRFALRHAEFFDTIVLETGIETGAVMAEALQKGFNLRDVGGAVAIALDETVTREDLAALAAILGGTLGEAKGGIPAALARSSGFLTAEVFSTHHSEHAMLRYLKRLEDKDVALNRSMIALGSCTMKLNATAEMIPITFGGFANIHPFAPVDQAQGYITLIRRLESWLASVTGFAAVSLQPNAGSQGEYAGLLAIREWHKARGEGHRNICLIPSSAHGTNPASAAMAGMKVVVTACDRDGNIDVADLKAKAAEHAANLSALMVTYPSTHGVFEEAIQEICETIHAHGGQVYMDGANMNAQVGLTAPGRIGADVCHLNLHKTFCIPHGGGGPGVGPIGVAAHLAPHLPNHPLVAEAGPATGYGPVSAAPFGSAAILPISYAYIRMMGADGLTKATQVAILNANYVAKRLSGHFPILYRGKQGMVAHECILDCRGFQQGGGVLVEDIAKRLQDYGFHAPTMSWPVAGTLMVEPTESEPKAELDRFVEAMIQIRAEIRAVEQGRSDKQDNPLKNAPHTASEVMGSDWSHGYSREEAAFPLPWVRAGKYWPPVKRVDNVYGDRNLICTCAPLEDYAHKAFAQAAE
ncbi:glycine dehydrogenase (aminomethyl-transferring) [Rhodovarius crocodyli]|uniref:Glycine dehydrogenase (decarboxylating) n=1 Tax=Rhodovarius crocodyli TaxID=1979269 RepID=A0A437M3Y7_9PROT|nr:aminomethyl-transferring glycine dehydrogenase [Rhodovarius crocodyli]RVT92316.1 glycine dehydrogenase (aminomethyl-transferring) [Rhodovarius crocodyli]